MMQSAIIEIVAGGRDGKLKDEVAIKARCDYNLPLIHDKKNVWDAWFGRGLLGFDRMQHGAELLDSVLPGTTANERLSVFKSGDLWHSGSWTVSKADQLTACVGWRSSSISVNGISPNRRFWYQAIPKRSAIPRQSRLWSPYLDWPACRAR
jgi:hypothetical protein